MSARSDGGGHNQALDGLRFVAFFLVFLHHAWQLNPSAGGLPPVRYGFVGVEIFFVLSGFLIGGILLDAKERAASLGHKLGTFYARRSLRIFPVYYLFLGFLAVRLVLKHTPAQIHEEFPWYVTYLTNVKVFLVGMDAVGYRHFWSLAVEEHFYLVAPIFVFLTSRRTLARALAGLLVFGTAARLVIALSGTTRNWSVLSPLVFDLLGVGIAAAVIHRDGSFLGLTAAGLRRLALVALVPCAIWFAGLGDGVAVLLAVRPLALAIVTAAVVLTLWQDPAHLGSRILGAQPFVYLGQVSYGLYLFHPTCLSIFAARLGRYSLANGVASLALTIAVATVSWYAFERPLNGLKRHFGYGVHPRPVAEPLVREVS